MALLQPLTPIGKVDPEFLRTISSAVRNKFHIKAKVGRKVSVPPDSYNALREQYNATVALKEMIHELGRVYGLDHCSYPKCIMYFSNSISDTDRKTAEFCDICKNTLEI